MSISIGMAINTHKQKLVEALNHIKIIDAASGVMDDKIKEYLDYYILKINPLNEFPLTFEADSRSLTLWDTVLEFRYAYSLGNNEPNNRLSMLYTIKSAQIEKFNGVFAYYYEEHMAWKIKSSKEDAPVSLEDGFETLICLILSQFIEESINFHVKSYTP
jgi:hypothetical protein